MSITDPESLKNFWSAIFRRNGADGTYTRLFDNLNAAQRSELLMRGALRDTELPVIGSFEDASNWLILTTERLVWSVRGGRHDIVVDAIQDATADFRRLQLSGLTKLEMRELEIKTLQGDEYSIALECGAPLIGTWNVLKHLGRRNRRAIQRQPKLRDNMG